MSSAFKSLFSFDKNVFICVANYIPGMINQQMAMRLPIIMILQCMFDKCLHQLMSCGLKSSNFHRIEIFVMFTTVHPCLCCFFSLDSNRRWRLKQRIQHRTRLRYRQSFQLKRPLKKKRSRIYKRYYAFCLILKSVGVERRQIYLSKI